MGSLSLQKLKHFYETRYLLQLSVTLLLLVIALVQIGLQYTQTGDFVHRGVSLKGGVTVTIPTYTDTVSLEQMLDEAYPQYDTTVRILRSSSGQQSGVILDADIVDDTVRSSVLTFLEQQTGVSQNDMSIETFGSRLSENFFRQLSVGLIIAFLFMGCVVFLYFKDIVPSIAIMLAAAADIIITLALVNLLEIKLSTAGIAAFLMLIGYSVDTDILLTIRVLKQKDDASFDERIYGAIKTGGLMTITALVAVGTVLFFTNSDILSQIMLILFIGLCVDIVNTWIQNVSILRWHHHRRQSKEQGKEGDA